MRNNVILENKISSGEYLLNEGNVSKILEFLKNEKEIYVALFHLELKKREAIFHTNGELLKDITRMEEIQMQKLEKNELLMENMMVEIKKKLSITENISFTQLLSYIHNKDVHKLIEKKEKLANIISQVKSANKMNSLLLNDRKDFFHHMIESISKENDISYNDKGKEKHHRKSIFINVTG